MQNRTDTSLLDLPHEIRHMIYAYTLCDQRIHIKPNGWNLTSQCCVETDADPIQADTKSIRDDCTVISTQSRPRTNAMLVSRPNQMPTWCQIPPLGVNLIRTCRAIYEETHELPYRNNIFLIHTLSGLFRFVQMLPPRHLALIKELWVSNSLSGSDFSRASYGERGMQKPRMDLGMLWCINNLAAGACCDGEELEVDKVEAGKMESVTIEEKEKENREGLPASGWMIGA